MNALGQALLNGKEDARPQNRSLDAAHAADQGDENHLRRPLDAEDRARQNVELADDEQRASGAAARRRDDVDDPLRRRDAHADASRGDLVVADRGQVKAHAAGKQHIAGQQSGSGDCQRTPVGNRLT